MGESIIALIISAPIMSSTIMALTCGNFFSPGQGHDPSLFPPFFAGTTVFCFFKIERRAGK